jgi:hypothetical protein
MPQSRRWHLVALCNGAQEGRYGHGQRKRAGMVPVKTMCALCALDLFAFDMSG